MSSSKSSSASSTDNFDQRAGADGGGIALGGGGEITIIDEFPEQVGEFALKILDVVQNSQSIQSQSTDATVKSIETIASREQSSALFAQDLLEKVTPIALIGGVVVLGVVFLRQRKR